MQAFLEIKAWPDVLPALTLLRGANLRLALLANLTVQMMDAGVTNSGLQGIFEPHLSTDQVQAFKPDSRAYQMGLDAFACRAKTSRLRPSEVGTQQALRSLATRHSGSTALTRQPKSWALPQTESVPTCTI